MRFACGTRTGSPAAVLSPRTGSAMIWAACLPTAQPSVSNRPPPAAGDSASPSPPGVGDRRLRNQSDVAARDAAPPLGAGPLGAGPLGAAPDMPALNVAGPEMVPLNPTGLEVAGPDVAGLGIAAPNCGTVARGPVADWDGIGIVASIRSLAD
jgi:hypothetical protein